MLFILCCIEFSMGDFLVLTPTQKQKFCRWQRKEHLPAPKIIDFLLVFWLYNIQCNRLIEKLF